MGRNNTVLRMFLTITIILLWAGCAQSKNLTRNEAVDDAAGFDLDDDPISFDDGDTVESGVDVADDGVVDATPDNGGYLVDGQGPAIAEEETGVVGGGDPALGGAVAYDASGNASWYGREFHGRKTASGEVFDMYELTAAHKEYPFNTVLEVQNLDNGKRVQVRVNDRGPYKDGRILDVSYAAGRELDMLAAGTARVTLRVVSTPSAVYPVTPPSVTTPVDVYDDTIVEGAYVLQCGAFYSKRNADSLKDRLGGMFPNKVIVVQEDDLFKVRVVGIATKADGNRLKQILAGENIPGYLIKN